ncbi:hypothetical protein M427DRAFT_160426 [Gonapodya prolifera JEL478]|uniref:Uncharacterized protein n=1 Tax=Gonapodya prolifera (strain JEL478) TaxID=1344416 RepID=A0A138ZZP9_GONPJ|nr:hypothetical protein M427DRAFT_160426 [Gonapodya prolifera JEL478]|eukprot:KXS09613.1 hypothetical protein M427DRAFT_160426 [Gonapodya prolifera JEL478]
MSSNKALLGGRPTSSQRGSSRQNYLPLSAIHNDSNQTNVPQLHTASSALMLTGTSGLLENAVDLHLKEKREAESRRRQRLRVGFGTIGIVALWVFLGTLGYLSTRKTNALVPGDVEPAQGSGGGSVIAQPKPTDEKQKFDLGSLDPSPAEVGGAQPSASPAVVDYAPNPSVVGAGVFPSSLGKRDEKPEGEMIAVKPTATPLEHVPLDEVLFGPSSHVVY